MPAQTCALDLDSGQRVPGKSSCWSLILKPGYFSVVAAQIIPSWTIPGGPYLLLMPCVDIKVQDAMERPQHPYMLNPDVWGRWCPMKWYLTDARQFLSGKSGTFPSLYDLFGEAPPSHGFFDILWIVAVISPVTTPLQFQSLLPVSLTFQSLLHSLDHTHNREASNISLKHYFLKDPNGDSL